MDLTTNRVIKDCIDLESRSTISRSGISKFPFNISKLRYSDKNNSVIHQILLETLIKAENLIPGGSKAMLRLIKSPVKQDSLFQVKKVSIKTLKESLKEKFNQFVIDTCVEATNLAGPSGKINIDFTESNNPSLELRIGYKFEVNSPLGNFSVKNPKIILLDGFIESVSEIHHFLTQASQSSEDVVVFLRGLSDDVLNTISFNHKRSSLFIKPIIVKFDENGINTLRDISVISSSRVISSDLGMLISSIDLHDSKNVNSISCFNGQLFIEEPGTTKEVEVHRQQLMKKLKECENDFGASLYETRIKSLSSRQVFFKVPKKENYGGLRQDLDSCLRSISFQLKNGVALDSEKYEEAIIYDLYENLIQVLNSKIIVV